MLFDDGLIAFLIPLSIVFMTLGSVLLIIEYFKKEKIKIKNSFLSASCRATARVYAKHIGIYIKRAPL